MSVSELKICNLAIAKLGARPIASLTENSQNARYCNTFYETSRNAVLRAYPWNFSTINRALASVSVPEGYSKWAYAYGYPNDCLQIQELHDDGGNSYPYEVSVYSTGTSQKLRIILTNLETAYSKYTVVIVNPELFDAQFIESFVNYLAKELAWPITKSHSTEQAMYQKYQLSVPVAQTADASEKNVAIVTEDSWITERLA